MLQFTEKQSEAWHKIMSPEIYFLLYGGAIRGGKSYFGVPTIFLWGLTNANSRYLILRKDLQVIKKNTLPIINRLKEENGLKYQIEQFDKDTFTIRLKNGADILLMGENYKTDKELYRFRGLEINGALLEEMNELQEDTFDKIMERMGSWLGNRNAPNKVVGTCNPSQNWVKTRIYDKWKKNKLPKGMWYEPAYLTDNPHLPEGYLEQLRERLPPLKFKMFVEGDWEAVEVENPFFYNYSPDKHLDESVVRDDRKQILVAMDFNLNPFAAIFANMWKDDEGEHIHFFDEVSIPHGSIDAMADYIRDTYGNKLPSIQITGDYMGTRGDMSQRDNAHLFEQLRRKLNLNSKQIKTKPNPTHENSRTDCNFVLANFPDLKVHPENCPSLVMDLSSLQCDAFGSIIKRDRKIITQRGDHGDSFRYYCNTYLRKWIDARLKRG